MVVISGLSSLMSVTWEVTWIPPFVDGLQRWLLARVRLVISRLVLIFALPLDFHGRVRVVRSMHLLAALHGIEPALLASDSLRKLRSSMCRVVWSRHQPMANVGAVRAGWAYWVCSCFFVLFGSGLGCFVGIFLFGLLRLVGFIASCRWFGEGCSGHGPVHLLSGSAAEIGFCLVTWLVRFSIYELLSLMLGIIRLPLTFVDGRVFEAGLCWMFMALCSSFDSSHVRERDKALLRSIMVGGVWNGFLLGRIRSQHTPCRFCGAPDGDGHLFWECTFPPLVEILESPEFHDLMREDKAHWPRCLLWHGWLLLLSGVNWASPWAADASQGCLLYG